MVKYRIGQGYDVHKLVENRDFFLGGIKIDYHKGPLAHSDGDVLIHALCDALLGAAALGDIGTHFPDNDPQYKNIDSKILLTKTMNLIKKNKYNIENIDITICLQQPKISPYIPAMINTLSQILDIPQNNLSIKATTTEKLGFIGRNEGISATAIILLSQNIQ